MKIFDMFGEIFIKDSKAQTKLKTFNNTMGAIGGGAIKVGKKVGQGIAIAGGVVAGFTGLAAKQFGDFEQGMNEVFTLLPDISEDAMDKMEKQVLSLSKEIGVLPSDVIPGLYSALSAGVPPDNVFAFLETSNQAAKGGVTDLETAVDGITSVVNTYGSEVITATQASDLMFTAVKNGKTTFDEIANSISEVAPIASEMGIGFDEVAAAVATMTAKGTPTTKVMTQLKGAFNELGKEGTVADKAFQNITGQSFPDFIAEGGSVSEALNLMRDSADENGTSINNMFGSIEAGQAALGLTGDNAKDFSDNLEDMQNSAGATEAAFETMDTGIVVAMDKVKASFIATAIEYGENLGPLIERVSGDIITFITNVKDTITGWFEDNGPKIDQIKEKFTQFFDRIKELIAPFIDGLKDSTGESDFLTIALDGLLDAVDFVADALNIAIDVIKNIIDWMKEHETLVKVLVIAFLAIKAAIILYNIIMVVATGVTTAFGVVMAVLTSPITLIILAIAAIIGIIILLVKNWDEVSAFLKRTWKSVADFAVKIWGNVKDFFVRLWASITDGVKKAWDFIKDLFFKFSPLGILIKNWGKITGFFSDLGTKIKKTFTDLTARARTWGKDLIDSFVRGVKAKIQKVKDTVANVAKIVKDFLGFSEPKKGALSNFSKSGGHMIESFMDSAKKRTPALLAGLKNLAGDINANISPTVNGTGAGRGITIINNFNDAVQDRSIGQQIGRDMVRELKALGIT